MDEINSGHTVVIECRDMYERACMRLPAPARVPVMPTDTEMQAIVAFFDAHAERDAARRMPSEKKTERVRGRRR